MMWQDRYVKLFLYLKKQERENSRLRKQLRTKRRVIKELKG